MAHCDFEVIDDDQDKPTENHMYMLQTLTVPELTRMVTCATSSEAVADLLAEAARICEGVYHEDGIQVRCAAVSQAAVHSLQDPLQSTSGVVQLDVVCAHM